MKLETESLIVWPCYEPAGCTVALTAEDLVQHLLIIGSTGCGKTTLLTRAIRQLVRQPVGLLILDAKQEGMVEQIAALTSRTEQRNSWAILGPQGTHALDLFGRLRGYEDVDTLTQWLMLATDPINDLNPYWRNTTTALIGAALTLLVASPEPVRLGPAVEFMRRWFFGLEGAVGMPPSVVKVVEHAKRKGAKGGACPQLQSALDYVQVWKYLDFRTRGNLQSCLLNVLRPLMSSAATRCFDTLNRPSFHLSEVATQGKLCVVSVNALTHPELAGFLFRLARRQFFDAVQTRGSGMHPLCGLVADEFPLIVQPEDSEQLATVRSRGCFVVAATQGLTALDNRIGERLRRSVLLNFNTLVWMRTREVEVGQLAAVTLGTREEASTAKPKSEWHGSQPFFLFHKYIVPVCPGGALGRLQPHQAYVSRADGSRTLQPVWFVPWFKQTDPDTPIGPVNVIKKFHFDAGYVEKVMGRLGFVLKSSPELVKAAVELDSKSHHRALEQAIGFFRSKACLVPRGLETLPSAWLAGMPGILWSLRKPQWTYVPYMIRHVGYEEGVLVVSFAQEEEHSGAVLTSWDRVRAVLNRCLYPSRWRSLSRRHRLELRLKRPDLSQDVAIGGPDAF